LGELNKGIYFLKRFDVMDERENILSPRREEDEWTTVSKALLLRFLGNRRSCSAL
jgi:hypothetical protein